MSRDFIAGLLLGLGCGITATTVITAIARSMYGRDLLEAHRQLWRRLVGRR